jgi:hypothetical protein
VSANDPRALRLELDVGPEVGTEEAELAVRRLRDELSELDVEEVKIPDGATAPSGAKGSGSLLSELIVTLSGAGGALPALISAAAGWVARDRSRRVVIEIDGDKLELVSASATEQRELVDAWLARRSASHG